MWKLYPASTSRDGTVRLVCRVRVLNVWWRPSHVQHPHAAHQSQGSIPQSWCRIEFSHEYDTLCSCRTEEWPSIRKEYIKKIKQTSKSKAEVDLVSVQPAIFTNTLWFFWYTQYWFMFIQLFYCNCQLVHIAFWVILCSYLVEASNKYFEV